MSPLLVLGIGQLGLMMAEAGARLGIAVDRLDPLTSEVIPGSSSFRVPAALEDLTERYPVISAEVEHLPSNPLVESIREDPRWINKVTFELLPDRASQKTMLDELEIATAPWCLVESADDIDELATQHASTLVLKTTRHGYDGKGQWRGSSAAEIDLPTDQLGHVIAETHVDFTREVSVLGVRSREGATYFYPLAENHHRDGILRYSIAPAGDVDSLQGSADALLGKIMTYLDYVGVMAVECFDTPAGLVVNEIAPRVHNSGHWTAARCASRSICDAGACTERAAADSYTTMSGNVDAESDRLRVSSELARAGRHAVPLVRQRLPSGS